MTSIPVSGVDLGASYIAVTLMVIQSLLASAVVGA